MIAKKIGRTTRGKFGRLAEYIEAAREKGEKLVDLWTVNAGGGGTDLDLAIAEAEAVQTLNGRSKADKTYHLMVSFRPGERPSPEEMKDIERAFAEALGFAEHQRVAGTHKNTDHFHMHVAYNRVHPERLTVETPWNDFQALEKTYRAMERKYGLYVDLGKSDYGGYGKPGRVVASAAARDFEARTWRQSFQNHVLDNREEIRGTAEKARTWRDLHRGLAALYLEIKRRGNGLALKRRAGPETVKAGLAGRELSRGELEERLGPYESMDQAIRSRPRRRYEARPLTRHPGVSRLWRAFAGRRKRPKTLAGRMAADWKQFLMNEAYRDPLALVIIMTYKEMFRGFSGPDRLPRTLRPALRHWIDAGKRTDGTPGPWLGEKGVARGLGLKEDGSGNLLVPFRDKDGHVWGLQVLKPDGKTAAVGGLGKKGLLHVIDPERKIESGKKPPAVVLTDNLAAAAAIREATRAPVALVPPGGDIKATVRSLRAGHGDCKAVAAGDASFAARAHAAGIEALEVKEWDGGKTETVKPTELRAKLAPLVGDNGFMAWTELKDAPWANPGNAPWLMKNNVRGFGLKLTPDGDVAMPLKDVHGRLHDVKFVSPYGASRRAGAEKETPPLVHVIDPARRVREDAIVVAGDYLSGAAIHKATRLPVAVAEGPDKTGDAARALRGRWPDSKLIIAADEERAGSLKDMAGELRAALVVPDGSAASFAGMAGDPDGIRDVLARPAGDAVWLRWEEAEPAGKDSGDRPEGLPPGLPTENLRRDKHGHVLVPLTDAGGRVWGLCALDGNGETVERLASGSPQGLMFEIGGKEAGGKGDAVIAEDLASAAALREATGRPTLCAFDSGNLKAVAEAWRRKHPKAEIAVAAADNGAAARDRSPGNAGEAAKAVSGKLVVPPPARDGKAQASFGDLWRDPSRRQEMRRQLAGVSGKGRESGIESGIER